MVVSDGRTARTARILTVFTQSTRFPKKPCLAVLFVFSLLVSLAVPVFAGNSGIWATTGSLNTARAAHTATLLPNGNVLVAGGQDPSGAALASAELYNPTTGTWTVIGSMSTARKSHAATLLASGEVLVVGGLGNSNPQAPCLASAELYNPSTGEWRPTGSMTSTRFSQGSTLLQNGHVLVAGGNICWGNSGGSSPGTSAEIYDPSSGSWKMTGSMNYARAGAQLTLLQNGEALIAAGSSFSPAQGTAELFSNGHWSLTSGLYFCCYHNSNNAVLLTNGDVVIYGANVTSYASEFYNPSTNVWQRTFGENYGNIRFGPIALLANGKVLLGGGVPKYGTVSSACMLYDPATKYWTLTGSLNQFRSSHTLTRLQNGQVLAAGGDGVSDLLSSAEVYTP